MKLVAARPSATAPMMAGPRVMPRSRSKLVAASAIPANRDRGHGERARGLHRVVIGARDFNVALLAVKEQVGISQLGSGGLGHGDLEYAPDRGGGQLPKQGDCR